MASEFTIPELPIKGLTLVRVERKERYGDIIEFEASDGRVFHMYHSQDCCESVTIKDIAGDLSDLVGAPIVMAEEITREATSEEVSEEGTWTFYRFGTVKGYVTITWLGSSNGYYSERVTFEEGPRGDDN